LKINKLKLSLVLKKLFYVTKRKYVQELRRERGKKEKEKEKKEKKSCSL